MTIHRPGDMHQASDEERAETMGRAAFEILLTGLVLGFMMGAATVGLYWTAVVVS